MKAKRLTLFLIWLMMVVAYFDRVNISLAGPTIMAALNLDKAHFGLVLSAFQFGYALMQVPGGFLADRLGARPLLIAALILWSVFTAATGLAGSLTTLIVIRVLFGFGEGIENGAQFKLIGDSFDSKERSTANGLFLTALAIGPALASPIVTWAIGQVGWPGLFFGSAILGLIVAGLLAVLLPRPSRNGDDIVHTSVKNASGHEINWGDALTRPTSWLAFAAYMFFNVGFWGFVYWMPNYLSTARHITLAKLGFTAAIPFICGFFGMLVIGHLGRHTLLRYRAVLVGGGYLIAAASLYGAFNAAELTPCIIALSCAAFFLYGGFGPFWAIVLDLIPDRMRGSFTGFVNLGGQIGGIVTPIVVGHIFDVTQSFAGGFEFMMAALVLAALSLGLLQAIAFSAATDLRGVNEGTR